MTNRLLTPSMVATAVISALSFSSTAMANADNCDKYQCPTRDHQGKVVESNDTVTLNIGTNQERLLPKASWTLHALPELEPLPVSAPHYESKAMKLESLPNLGFSSGKHALSNNAKEAMDEIIAQLNGKKNIRLSFVGHADNQRLSINAKQRYKDNIGLSKHRANIVAQYFKQTLDLQDDQLTVVGKGDTSPVASNDTAEGMRKNRRVELHAWYDEISVISPKMVTNIDRTQICQNETAPQAFSITLDGDPLTKNDAANNADMQRCVDVAFDKADIKLSYDQHALSPKLASKATAWADDNNVYVTFAAFSNYRHFINKAEIRLLPRGKGEQASPIATLPIKFDEVLSWQITRNDARPMDYVLRVYSDKGEFDQTILTELNWLEEEPEANFKKDLQVNNWQQNQLTLQNIKLSGGLVTATGANIPDETAVYSFGYPTLTNQNGEFVSQQILPVGIHRPEVALLDHEGNGYLYQRNFEFKGNNWFYVAMADITVGENKTTGPIKLLTGNEHHFNDDVFVDGRFSFYTKGTWLEDYTITASLDTKEEAAEDILSNLSKKDPKSLFRRLEEENHYAVYGDDSTLIEDAPTQGRFYARINDNKSHAMWGSFVTDIKDTEFARLERGLYGFISNWRSESVTQFGERQTQIDLFAAEAGTNAAYEEHRGTGGSLYYLENQDITRGSERVTIEVRDKDSGLVIASQILAPGQDYDVDSLQGRILLTKPLSSISDDNLIVRTNGISGHPTYLVVNYEFTPGFDEIEDLAFGGRAKHWITDNWQVGVSGQKQEQGQNDHNLKGLDLTYRHSGESYLKLEIAESEGAGTQATSSLNGGFHFNDITQPINVDNVQGAARIESGFAFKDFGASDDNLGRGQFYWQRRDAGFSAPGQFVRHDTTQVGLKLDMPIGEDTVASVRADSKKEDAGVDKTSAEINVSHEFTKQWQLAAGVRTEDIDNGILSSQQYLGQRTDLAVQLDYQDSTIWGVHAFAQGTLDRDDSRQANNRAGIGGNYLISDSVRLSGEVSDGNQGFGAILGSDYQYSEAGNIYLNYELDPDRTDRNIQGNNGQLVSGVKHRFTNNTSVYGEQRYQHGDNQVGLTQAYGIEYLPSESWLMGVSLENGSLESPGQETLDRNAVAFNASYRNGGFKYGGAIEYREDKRASEERDSYLLRNNLAYKVNPDWRAQLRVDIAVSNSSTSEQLNSDYTEALLGFAYRPMLNDSFNALVTFNYLADLAPSDQFNQSRTQNNYQQKSHVFAIDANYDLSARWSIGGKYARRTGEIRQGREAGEWFDSTASLYIARVDWHLVRHWDAIVEARLLESSEAQDQKKGFLTAIHRHLGNHFKVGIGYNFTDFSDDLTHLDYDAKGWFINLVGKM